jgi:uncharacterized protein
VVNVSKGGIVIAHKVALAGTSALRRRGLLGQTELAEGEGLYISPCEWLHTFGMRFHIDIAFTSPSGQLLVIYHGLKPNRLSKIVWRAQGALELAEGTLKKTNTTVGDTVQFLSITSS